MNRITIKEFASMAVALQPGETIAFLSEDTDGQKMKHQLACVQFVDSYVLLANCEGGGRAFSVDITEYNNDLTDICESYDRYINDESGHYGFVDAEKIVQNSDTGAILPDKHMLISVCERNIRTSIYPTYAEAYDKMVSELDEAMDSNRQSYQEDSDYSLSDYSAWSNARNMDNDWEIVKIK